MIRVNITPRAVTLAAGLALAAASTAHGQAMNWNNANGGSAGLSSNWNPTAVPTASNSLIFNINSALATIPVTFPLIANNSSSHSYHKESYTLTCSSPHTATNGILVGVNSGDNATVILTTGTLQDSTATSQIGLGSGSTGVMTVNDDDAFWRPKSVIVGTNGNGTLNITGGGQGSTDSTLNVALNPTSVGAMTVSGQLNTAPFTRSTFEANGLTGHRIGTNGDGTVNVLNGGLLKFASELGIGTGLGSVSSVNVQGLGLVAKAELNVASDVLIGRNNNVSASGSGTLTIGSNGIASIKGGLSVGGDPNGGTAKLAVGTLGIASIGGKLGFGGGPGVSTLELTGGLIEADSLFLDSGTVLDLDGGTINIKGGTFTSSGIPAGVVLGGGPGNAVIRLKDKTLGTLPKGAGANALTIGSGTAGADAVQLQVLEGSELIAAGDVPIGVAANDVGTLTISGIDSFFNMPDASTLRVGVAGSGLLQIEDDGLANVGDLFIGQEIGSDGTVHLQNLGKLIVNSVEIGGDDAAAGGAALLSVIDSSFMNMTDAAAASRIWPGGELILADNSTMNSMGAMTMLSGAVMDVKDGGEFNGTQFTMQSGSALKLNVNPGPAPQPAVVRAEVKLLDGAVVDVGPGGAELGKSDSGLGFTAANASVINLHGQFLTINDANAAVLGDVNLTDGATGSAKLMAPGGFVLNNGCAITGAGVIDGDIVVNPGGSINATGIGIVFNEMLTRETLGSTIGGTHVQFAFSGGFQGLGSIDAPVLADAGATITATGPLTMGKVSSSGFTISGTLMCGNEIVTLVDSNGVILGKKTEIAGGTLIQSVTLGLLNGQDFQGFGIVDAPLFNINGDIFPGDTDADGPDTATITCSGDVVFGTSCDYLAHIGPPGFGKEFPECDLIRTTQAGDTVQISGGTLHVAILPGYTPDTDDFFDIIIGKDGVAGFFDEVFLPPLAQISYMPDRVRIHFCYPDCDGDQTLSVDDFICFQTLFAIGDAIADCDQDGFLSIDDFICFQTMFAIGC